MQRCFYRLKEINYVSLKLKISDAWRHELKVNYKGVTEYEQEMHSRQQESANCRWFFSKDLTLALS